MAGIGLLSVKSRNRLGDRDRECFHASRCRDSTFEHSSKGEFYTRTVSLKPRPDSLDKPLPALPGVIVAPMPDCDALPLTKPCRDPRMVFVDYTDNIELEEIDREQGQRADSFSMDDGVEGSDEGTALLPTSTSGLQKRRCKSSSGERTLKVYFQKGSALLKRQLRFLCAVLHYDTSYHKLGGTIAPPKEENLAVKCPAPKFISEKQFWLMLERFFGLVSLPDSLANTFPTQGQIAYIQNFLQSQPTPREDYRKKDSRKELVKVCIKLTAFIFRDRESKRIFLGVGRQSHGSQNSPWKIFQGFGLIERYLVETENGQPYTCTDESLVLWLQVRCIFSVRPFIGFVFVLHKDPKR